MKPRMLDLFCCQGGAAMGYHRAGFEVVGVDINPQPRYPFEFHQGDALAFVAEHGHEFDAIHASPPCQFYTNAQRIMGNEHPDMLDATRRLLNNRVGNRGALWVIENVPGAPLIAPVELCGLMFDLGTYRHRLFETSVRIAQPLHGEHHISTTKMGRVPQPGEFMHVVGNFSGVEQAKAAMGGLDWMSRDGLREAIPPAYTQFIGEQLLAHLSEAVA